MTIYPLLVRPCAWQEVEWLARLQVRPRSAKPLASHRGDKIDELLAAVSREVAALVKATTAADGGKDQREPGIDLSTHSKSVGPWDQSGERLLRV